MLEQLDVIFDTRKLLELDFRVVDLKFHIGTYFTTDFSLFCNQYHLSFIQFHPLLQKV